MSSLHVPTVQTSARVLLSPQPIPDLQDRTDYIACVSRVKRADVSVNQEQASSLARLGSDPSTPSVSAGDVSLGRSSSGVSLPQ